MIVRFSTRAEERVEELESHYFALGRDSAVRQLRNSLAEAIRLIGSGEKTYLIAPRPYPQLAAAGLRWIHVGRYWIGYKANSDEWLIASVYFNAANIPARFREDQR